MGNRGVNFRLVPSSMEVIIGKTHIDVLDDIPLVDIDYNINRAGNKTVKRTFDIVGSFILMLVLFPFPGGRRDEKKECTGIALWKRQLPLVFKGEMSLVGPPADTSGMITDAGKRADVFLGKSGITGLVQINRRPDITPEEVEKYSLYYAKNQSMVLDIEILLKTFFGYKQREKENGKRGTGV